MKLNKLKYCYILIGSAMLISCNDNPKVITASADKDETLNSSGIFSEESIDMENNEVTSSSFTEDLHTVVVNEILPTSKYAYLKVTENGEQFWIATARQDVKVNETYFYRDGLLKTNFESKEYNRIFDKIYLVSNLVSENHGGNSLETTNDFIQNNNTKADKENIPTHTEELIEHKGSIKIAELVANPKKYEGKTVQITGKCVKINPNIMNRNWIHLQDGSKNEFDLVVTTNTFVAEGEIVTIKAEVSLNRDFGAGYRYDLILENGIVVK